MILQSVLIQIVAEFVIAVKKFPLT